MKEMKEMCWPSGDTNGLAPRVSQADAYLVISALGTGGEKCSHFTGTTEGSQRALPEGWVSSGLIIGSCRSTDKTTET